MGIFVNKRTFKSAEEKKQFWELRTLLPEHCGLLIFMHAFFQWLFGQEWEVPPLLLKGDGSFQ